MSAVILMIALLAADHIDQSNADCENKLDILLLVDGSTTVCNGTETCEKWNSTLEFCKNIASGFTIGSTDTKIAFILMSDALHVQWNLDGHTNETTLLKAIDNVAYTGGVFTELSLVSAPSILTQVFNPFYGDRPDALNVVMLITDGVPDIGLLLDTVLSTVFQQLRIAAFVVGVRPGCTEDGARAISSPPRKVNETYFMVDSYFLLDPVKDGLVNKSCQYKFPLIPGVG